MDDQLIRHYMEMEELKRRMLENQRQPTQPQGGGMPSPGMFKSFLGGSGGAETGGASAASETGAGMGPIGAGSIAIPLYAGAYYGSRGVGNSVDTSHWMANPFVAQFRTAGKMAQSSPKDWLPNTYDFIKDTPNKLGDQFQRFGSFLGRLF